MTDLLKAFTQILKLLAEPTHFIFVLVILILFVVIWWLYQIINKQGDFCIKITEEIQKLNTANTELVTLLRILVNKG